MTQLHQRIVEEIVQTYKNSPEVIGIRLVGSVGRGEERPDSDVDIEVVKEGNSWYWEKQERYGLHVDFVISTRAHLLYQFQKYPYLCFIDTDKKILYDPTGFLAELRESIESYLRQHPEVLDFWSKQFQEMRELKAKGQKPRKSLIDLFDEAEILFSDEHKVTRDWLRVEFKHK